MTIDRRTAEGLAFLAAFALCIPAANWLIGHAGTTCVPNGPCLIPVAPGLKAPSGVLMIGLALVLRDLVQRRLGLSWSFAAIVAGTALSALIAPPALVIASAAAFFVSEMADLAVYTPLQKRGLIAAVKSGRIPMERLDDSVRRQIAWKHELGLFKDKLTPIDRIDSLVSVSSVPVSFS